jgi:hypothetical protein
VVVGDASAPYTQAGTFKNHHLIYGLVPLKSEYSAKQLVGEAENYVVQTQHTFIDMLLEYVTGGIYTPTTTTVFVPIR